MSDTAQYSRGLRLVARFLKRGWQWMVAATLAVALGVVAYLSPGIERADVHLDEGTVYAVNRATGMVGMVNTQIDRVVQASNMGDSESRLLQHEETVVIYGPKSNSLTPYNPSRNRLDRPTSLPAGADVRMIGPRLLVSSPQNGKVWYGNIHDVLGLDLTKDKAHFEVGVNGTATLTTAGEVIGVSVERSEVLRYENGEVTGTKVPFKLAANVAGEVAVSAVGDRAVVLDRANGLLWAEGMPQAIEVDGAREAILLPPVDDILDGEEKYQAVFANGAGLVGVTSNGTKSLSGSIQAAPIMPVQVGGCIYGLFANTVVKRCANQDPVLTKLPGYEPTSGADLSFQVNRRGIALNEQTTGATWMIEPEVRPVGGWEDFRKEEVKDDDTTRVTDVPPERTGDNRPPKAQDDRLAARAGRSTFLDVLDNDSDPDGDVLTISPITEIEGATLERVRGGSGLQITIPRETEAESFSFSYEVFDGKERASAQVVVRVADADPANENEPPYPFHISRPVKVSLGGSFTKRVLLDWRDPEGDPLILEDAWMPEGTEVPLVFNPDGTLTYQDVGKQAGVKKIRLKVSDGTASAESDMLVTVVDEPVAPLAYADFATARVGETITVEPLANDIGENMALLEVDPGECSVCRVVPEHSENRFTFSASKAGTYYLTYNVSSGPIDSGVIRIDVLEPNQGSRPVAALDVALLPPQGAVTVDPLLNDSDADGDVLVIQSLSIPPGLTVELQRRHIMTIKAKTVLAGPVTVGYVISDGKHTARGSVVVVPTGNTGSVFPVANNDSVRVRAGSIGTARVLENDTSPLGLELKLTKILSSQLGENAWIDGNAIRVRMPAGSLHQQYPITYEVVDTEGKRGEAVLNVTAISEDAANVAPAPPPVEDRVLAGSRTRIPIRLDGIDPNGDAVRLVGLGSGPRLGAVTAIGDSFLVYEAFPKSAGTDSFFYQVSDSQGLTAVGEMRIGVAALSESNAPPIPGDDVVRVRPGRPIQISALGNDRDLEGGPLRYAEQDAVRMEDPELKVSLVEDREVSIEPITKPGQYSGTYRVVDNVGQEAVGSLLVSVEENAPLLPPVTRPDVLGVSDIKSEDVIEIDVLSNDFDPDGAHDALQLAIPEKDHGADPDVWVNESRRVGVRVGDRMKQFRYLVRDTDGNESFGLVTVPGKEDVIPIVRDPGRVPVVVAGQSLSLSLDEYILGTRGRKVRLTTSDSIVATNGRAIPSTSGIEYTPDLEYFGPAAVTFEVVDVVPDGDNTFKRAFVTIRVEVQRPPQQVGGPDDIQLTTQPPNQLTQPVLQVAPDEGDFRLALTGLFSDPQGLDFNFDDWAVSSGDAPITWRAEAGNSVIIASAPLTAKRGSQLVLSGRVINAQNASRPVNVSIEVVASKQPLTVTNPDNLDEAAAGVPTPIPVTLNDISFLSDKTLKVVGARILSGNGTITYDDQSVTVTPQADEVGTLTASYSVMDATGDPDRVVDGTIRMTVSARPSAPTPPFGGVAGDGQITFEYRSGAENGFPVEKRVVTATSSEGQSVSQECPGQICTITGLKNGVPWTLRMVDWNKLGASDPSAESAPYTPDVRPLPPGPPALARGDQSLQMAWNPAGFADPSNPGSAVTKYTLRLYDVDGGGEPAVVEVEAGGSLSYTWTGLTNGRNYQASVVATNNAGSSDESARSDPMFPVGPPRGAPTARAAVEQSEEGGTFRVSVGPGTLDGNGDPSPQIRVVPVIGGDERGDLALSGSLADLPKEFGFSGLGKSSVSFVVRVSNLHSSDHALATTESLVSLPTPKVGDFTVVDDPDSDGRLQVNLSVANLGDGELGALNPVAQYKVGGSWQQLEGAIGGKLLTQPLIPGRKYQVSVRLVLTTTDGQQMIVDAGTLEAMPVSVNPKPLPMPRVYFKGSGSGGTLNPDEGNWRWAFKFAEPKPEDTGGWSPNSYSIQAGGVSGVPGEVIEISGNVAVQQFVGTREISSSQINVTPPSFVYSSSSRTISVAMTAIGSARCSLQKGGVLVQDFQGNDSLSFSYQLPGEENDPESYTVHCGVRNPASGGNSFTTKLKVNP